MERQRSNKRRPYGLGGFNRAELRHRRYDEAAERADRELLSYRFDESSFAFSPTNPEPELGEETNIGLEPRTEETIIYEDRRANVAKRRAKINGLLLKNPQGYHVSKSNQHFIQKHFQRFLRFAKTLKNKGKLRPEVEDILGV